MELTLEQRLDRIERLLTISAKNIWSVKDLALILDVKEDYIYQLCSKKQIPYYKQGASTWFNRNEIEQWQMQTRIHTEEEIQSAASTYCALNKPKYLR